MSKVRVGWMVGRALPESGPGRWWAYITIVDDLDDAIARARDLARAENVRAWLLEGEEISQPISLDAAADPQ